MVSWLVGFLLLPSLFPDGRPASAGWARAVRATAARWVLVIVAFMTQRRELSGFFEGNPAVPDPPRNPTGLWFAGSAEVGEAVIGVPWIVVTLASVVTGIGSLVTRWRGEESSGRRQVGLVVAALALLLAVVGLTVLTTLVEGMGIELVPTVVLDIAFMVTLVTWSAALGVAVLRLRLYEVDLVVNRTVVYGILTAGVVATATVMAVTIGSVVPRDGGRFPCWWPRCSSPSRSIRCAAGSSRR